MQYVKGPDFAGKCEIRGLKGIEEYFRTGRGTVRLRGKIDIDEQEGGKSILTIREVPHGVNRATLQERIAELVNEKVLTGISGMRDLSDEETRIEIELKRDARPQVVANQIFKLTSMDTSYSVNMLAIHEKRPKMLTLKDAIDCYIEHRREVIVRRTKYLLRKAEDRAENLEAYLLALGHLDDFIHIIRSSKNRDEARERLASYTFPVKTAESLGILIRSQPSVQGDTYVFSERQVNAILELRLYQLTGMERDKIKAEYDSVLAEIVDFMDIIAREIRVLTIIKEELRAIADKYGSPRRCPILPDEGEIAIEDLIANDSMVVTLTHRGYIKRTPSSEFRVQARGGKGLRGMETRTAKDQEDDFIEHLFSTQAHDYLMFFTNTGRVYVERVYDIPEGSRAAKGRGIRNVLNLQPDEKIAALLRLERTTDENNNDITFRDEAGFLLFATKVGLVKKTPLNDYRNYRKAGLNAINLEEGDELIGVRLTTGNDEVVLVTKHGISIRFHEEQARSMGRTATGVWGIRPEEDDQVVSLALVTAGSTLLVAAENGLGKRTAFEEYRLQSRGGKGIITMKVTEKTGNVVGAVTVEESDELMLMTNTGLSIRIKVNTIRETGRNAQGVKLLSMKEGESLQDISKVIPDGEDNGDSSDSESDPALESAPPSAEDLPNEEIANEDE
jgi:DNA gyrase subunit A